MIGATTKDAIIRLLATDPTATEDEREKVARALAGEHMDAAIIRIADAAKRLGCTRQTIHNLVKRGKLETVAGSGSAGSSIGITAESFRRYIKGRAA